MGKFFIEKQCLREAVGTQWVVNRNMLKGGGRTFAPSYARLREMRRLRHLLVEIARGVDESLHRRVVGVVQFQHSFDRQSLVSRPLIIATRDRISYVVA